MWYTLIEPKNKRRTQMIEYTHFEIEGTKVVLYKDDEVVDTVNLLALIDEALDTKGYRLVEDLRDNT